ncbi:MAG: SDR family NAD(P)-dependent oxidoreductase [Clostridia bacterium]|nr:SDR family NAD(P)-dependent oxidoreductase [Clostridia bacterium]
MKYVLVTGGRGGMGKAVVDALAAAGYFVFALDKSAPFQDAALVEHLQVDVTDEGSVEEAFNQIKSKTSQLFAILHFAGIYALDSLLEMDETALKRVFDVNLLGCARINRIFAPLLQAGSRILITSSELAPLDPLPFTGVYAVAKAALDKYAYSLRMEVQLLGVQVATIRPGAVDTGMIGVSTDALEKFCHNTKLYACNATRFKRIVDGVEARKIPAEKIGKLTVKILAKKRMKYVYSINRNPLLLLLNALPKRMQTGIIKRILR